MMRTDKCDPVWLGAQVGTGVEVPQQLVQRKSCTASVTVHPLPSRPTIDRTTEQPRGCW